MKISELLKDLQIWYKAQCDGDWEHEYGIEINTIDNPGWRLKIDLEDTILDSKEFKPIKRERSKEDWCYCKIEERKFLGYGGTNNLSEILDIFIKWAKTENDWLATPFPPP